jgi:parallel beta-helix repeat protein
MLDPSIGIYLDVDSYSSVVVGNIIGGGAGTGLYLKNSGQNVISSNNIAATGIALDVQGGAGFPTYSQIISNNNVVVAPAGITLRHNQNSKTTYIGNTFRNSQTDVYIAPTIVTGTPVIISTAGTAGEISVLSGVVNYPATTLVVAGGGGTNVVTAGVVDSGGVGFRVLRIPN